MCSNITQTIFWLCVKRFQTVRVRESLSYKYRIWKYILFVLYNKDESDKMNWNHRQLYMIKFTKFTKLIDTL